MAQTVISGKQVKDSSIQRVDLDTVTVGQAVVAKLLQGAGISLSSTGADAGTGDVTVSVTAVPTASVVSYAGSSAPAGWLLCDGSAQSRTTYAALYTALGGASSPWGQGDGSTTFNVPDLRGRVGIGAGAGTGLTNRVLAATGGEETHQLSIAELASHTHTDLGHTHGVFLVNNVAPGGSGANSVAGSGASTPSSTGVASLQNTGSGTAHNTMPPFAVLNWIIKT